MRILQVCSAREIGGGEKHLADLSNSLARRGHEVIAALIPASPLVPELPTVPAEKIIELAMRNALSLGSAVKLARLARANKVDLIHAHVARDYPLAALAAGRANVPLVLTRHVLFPLSKVHRLTLRRTARVIAVSQAVADSLRAQNVFEPGKIVVIHNGIDVDRFARGIAPGRAEKSAFCVGMIGHLAPIKGQEDFIRAAAIVCERRDDVSFVIAGEDKSRSGENRAGLEKLNSDLNLNEKVRLIGWAEDVATLLSSFDLYVSPARSEPFGLSIVEAMAAGVPVIATASEGAREILEDQQIGILVPIGDFEALANSICDLLSNAEQRQTLAVNATRVAREQFSLQRMVMNTEQIYKEVLRQ